MGLREEAAALEARVANARAALAELEAHRDRVRAELLGTEPPPELVAFTVSEKGDLVEREAVLVREKTAVAALKASLESETGRTRRPQARRGRTTLATRRGAGPVAVGRAADRDRDGRDGPRPAASRNRSRFAREAPGSRRLRAAAKTLTISGGSGSGSNRGKPSSPRSSCAGTRNARNWKPISNSA